MPDMDDENAMGAECAPALGSGLLCRGSWALGTACGRCQRCLDTKAMGFEQTRQRIKIEEAKIAVQAAYASAASASIAELDHIQDYRFGSMVKNDRYAFARGLTINPQHLPEALKAMEEDDWYLLAIFGQTDAKSIGFIFRRQPSARSFANEQTLSHALTLALAERDKAITRSDELHHINSKLIEQRRDAQNALDMARRHAEDVFRAGWNARNMDYINHGGSGSVERAWADFNSKQED